VQEREAKRSANADAGGWPQDEFSRDLGHGNDAVDHDDATEETRLLGHHEDVPDALAGLDRGEREAIPVLVTGSQLRQGSVYVDLDNVDAGPFRAVGGQRAEAHQRLVPKHRIEFDLWNALVGQGTEPESVQPDGA
jgi:hypothetical protein